MLGGQHFCRLAHGEQVLLLTEVEHLRKDERAVGAGGHISPGATEDPIGFNLFG